jgi:hypothetical protein
MTDLSPAAQAVFNAAWADTGIILGDREGTLRAQLAAALRALASASTAPTPSARTSSTSLMSWRGRAADGR